MFARLTLPGSSLLLVGLLAPASALAGNGIHPRTPVKWDPTPACMTVVDRSIDATLTFNYTIPYEDLRPKETNDEVDDSRRHQFIAFCQGQSPQQPLPVWLSTADVDVAKAVGIVDMEGVKPKDVLAENPEWQACFTRITADDQRRKITFAEAMKPVVWDTTGLAAGAYLISGYTWEPSFNIWSLRPGVVKVVDDPDPVKNGPAMAITNVNEIKFSDEILTLVGCVDAMDGSTMTGYWALTDDETDDVLEWMSFGEDTPVSGDSFELPFPIPAQAVGEDITMKIVITDPMDRSYTAYLRDLASILPGSQGGTGDCSDSGMSFIGMPGCESEGGESSGSGDAGTSSGGAETHESAGVTTTATATTATTMTTMTTMPATTASDTTGGGGEETGVMEEPLDRSGCAGCSSGSGGLPALLFAPWLLWATRRRRA